MKSALFFGLDRFNWILLGLAAAILGFILLVPPIVGVGDNGDWYRIMHPSAFQHLPNPPQDARFFVDRVALTPWSSHRLREGHVVSGLIAAIAARVIGSVVSRDGTFPLPAIGILHSIVLLLGMGLILRGTQSLYAVPRRIIGVLLVFFFTDLGYSAFLNSFYTQTSSLLFLLTTVGAFVLILGGRRAEFWYAVFVVSALFFVTSKAQEAAQSLLLAIPIVWSARRTKLRRPFVTGSLLALAVILLAFICATRSNRLLHDQCLYNQVFDDLLRYSPDATADLRTLNLDSSLLIYQSHHAFEANSPIQKPEFREQFFARVDYPDVLLFYLGHPVRLWNLLSRRAQLAFTIVTPYGNYDRSVGRPAWAKSKSFTFWSTLKRTVLPGSIWTLIVLFSAQFIAIYAAWKRRSQTQEYRLGLAGFAILNLMAIGAFLICALFDGRIDIIRQLFAFNAMTDLMLLTDAAVLVYVVRAFWQSRNGLA
jgi:hypothetical protein